MFVSWKANHVYTSHQALSKTALYVTSRLFVLFFFFFPCALNLFTVLFLKTCSDHLIVELQQASRAAQRRGDTEATRSFCKSFRFLFTNTELVKAFSWKDLGQPLLAPFQNLKKKKKKDKFQKGSLAFFCRLCRWRRWPLPGPVCCIFI